MTIVCKDFRYSFIASFYGITDSQNLDLFNCVFSNLRNTQLNTLRIKIRLYNQWKLYFNLNAFAVSWNDEEIRLLFKYS